MGIGDPLSCNKGRLDTYVVVGSSLIDMYSKCGQVKNAESMFQLLPKRNIITWNAMISGYAYNGDSGKVIQQLRELKMVADLKPDGVTFLNVIAACSNTEVPLQQAIGYFESMINDYGIEPTIEHCCSMIRLMGQRGEGFKVANIAAAKVIELEGDDDYVYVMMSNIFASYGKWRDVSKVRKIMRDRGGLSMAWNKRIRELIQREWEVKVYHIHRKDYLSEIGWQGLVKGDLEATMVQPHQCKTVFKLEVLSRTYPLKFQYAHSALLENTISVFCLEFTLVETAFDLVTGDFGALDLMKDLMDDRDDLEMNLLQDEAMMGDAERKGKDLEERLLWR
ncbi:hypothetical protein GH714_009195 [Hevea brasiliensis]|uniref:Pentatricopeptide repeat-containing protein n=1 Tax=Hevea brasiliensis TaxID=3981 RepID=A0A6A6MM69_HEVBR|nr:hypothetical protein GH714_009195 [Hevea brasiliensis]